jgi:hypothetical protein
MLNLGSNGGYGTSSAIAVQSDDEIIVGSSKTYDIDLSE